MRLFGGGQTGGTDIRILSSLTAKGAATSTGYGEASVIIKDIASQVVPENASHLIRSRTGHEEVRMVVKQETMNPAAVGDLLRPGTPPNPLFDHPSPLLAKEGIKGRSVPTGGGVAAAAMQAMQPKIDVNRLTDEVYRMLERRLITERERRGR